MDLAQEIIYPAFFDESNQRRHGPTAFFFREVGLADINIEGRNSSQLTIYGRFIKDTILSRAQVYSDTLGLIADPAVLPSAPSAFFALDFDNHKLMYVAETPGAPSMRQFALTLESFASKRRRVYIRELKAESKKAGNPQSIGELGIEYPEPSVEVTPLSGDTDIDTFIERFEKITRVGFQLKNTNAELNRAEDFRLIRGMKDAVLSDRTTLTHENRAGLRKDAVAAEVKAAAAGGNQSVKLTGTAPDGTELTGSNEDLKLQIAVVQLPSGRFSRAYEMVKSYFAQVDAGRLRPDVGRPDVNKLAALKGALDGTER